MVPSLLEVPNNRRTIMTDEELVSILRKAQADYKTTPGMTAIVILLGYAADTIESLLKERT